MELCTSWVMKGGFSTLSGVIQEMHYNDYYRRFAAYVQCVDLYCAQLGTKPAVPFTLFPPFDSPAFGGQRRPIAIESCSQNHTQHFLAL
jgi:hypothetical protein